MNIPTEANRYKIYTDPASPETPQNIYRRTCPKCRGDGRWFLDVKCPRCKGTGWVLIEK